MCIMYQSQINDIDSTARILWKKICACYCNLSFVLKVVFYALKISVSCDLMQLSKAINMTTESRLLHITS